MWGRARLSRIGPGLVEPSGKGGKLLETAFAIEDAASDDLPPRVAQFGDLYEALSAGLSVRADPGLSRLVCATDYDAPFQRWFQYREGFTVEMCNLVISNSEALVVDPFCGFGSTLIASKMKGLRSFGMDVNPLAAFVSDVK